MRGESRTVRGPRFAELIGAVSIMEAQRAQDAS